MGKNNQRFEYIGKLNPAIAERWNLKEHTNKPIVIYNIVRRHIVKRHLKDFGSEEEIDYVWSKLRSIIKKPDEVFYNSSTKGLEYYKKINDMIIVAVRIDFGETLKIMSFYPANQNKLNNRRNKEEQMIINGEIDDILI